MYSLGCKLIRVGWVIHFWMLNDAHFVWLDPLLICITITILLVRLESIEKKFTIPFNPFV